MSVKFISYDGEYPNLCSGTLVLEINGNRHKLQYALRSGGCVLKDDDWNMWAEQGPWSVNIPKELEEYRYEIEEAVNSNVHEGCCGGCI